MTTHGELWVLAMNNIRPLRLFKVPCCHGELREQDGKLIKEELSYTLTCQETACGEPFTVLPVMLKIIYIYIINVGV